MSAAGNWVDGWLGKKRNNPITHPPSSPIARSAKFPTPWRGCLTQLESVETAQIADLGFETVHGADFVGSTSIITWATQDSKLFRTTTAGVGTGTDDMSTGIEVFGGSAIPILLGGTAILIDKSSLLLGAVQLNAGWITPFVFAGLALVIYKISRKN